LVVEFNSDVKLEDGYWAHLPFLFLKNINLSFKACKTYKVPDVLKRRIFLLAASAGKLVTDHPKQEVVDLEEWKMA